VKNSSIKGKENIFIEEMKTQHCEKAMNDIFLNAAAAATTTAQRPIADTQFDQSVALTARKRHLLTYLKNSIDLLHVRAVQNRSTNIF